MHAAVGDHIRIHSRTLGQPERIGTVIEVRGPEGEPPYVVDFGDGQGHFMIPGTDCEVEPATHPST